MKEILEGLASDGRIRLVLDGPMATIWLEHPRRRNAMSAQMMLDLAEVVSQLESWEGSVLVVRGAERQFCAGADLRLMDGVFSTPEGALWMSDWMSGLLNRIFSAPFLSFSLVEGAAMGGGAELACSTDFRIQRRGARFQFVQASRGVSPGWGGAGRLRELVGRQGALRLLGTGEPLAPEWGLALGVVDWVLEEDASEADLMAILEPFLAKGPSALRANKRAVLAERSWSSRVSERDCFASTVAEGHFAAFQTKKGPQP